MTYRWGRGLLGLSGASVLHTERLLLADDVLGGRSTDWLHRLPLSFFTDRSRTLSWIESCEMWCTTPEQWQHHLHHHHHHHVRSNGSQTQHVTKDNLVTQISLLWSCNILLMGKAYKYTSYINCTPSYPGILTSNWSGLVEQMHEDCALSAAAPNAWNSLSDDFVISHSLTLLKLTLSLSASKSPEQQHYTNYLFVFCICLKVKPERSWPPVANDKKIWLGGLQKFTRQRIMEKSSSRPHYTRITQNKVCSSDDLNWFETDNDESQKDHMQEKYFNSYRVQLQNMVFCSKFNTHTHTHTHTCTNTIFTAIFTKIIF